MASILLFILLSAPLSGAVTVMEQPSSQGFNYGSCIKVAQSGSNRSAYSFYNGCGEELWINACIEGSFNKTQIARSAKAIQVNGRFTIYPFFDINVKKITWTAHPYLPVVPGVCGLPAKKK